MRSYPPLLLPALAAVFLAQGAEPDPAANLRAYRDRISMDIGAGRFDSVTAFRDSARRAETALRIHGFTPFEVCAVELLGGRFGFFRDLDSLRKYDSPEYGSKLAVSGDPLSLNIIGDFLRGEPGIREQLRSRRDLPGEEKSFLELVTRFMGMNAAWKTDSLYATHDSLRAEVNFAARAFLDAYPGSRYADFVRSDIREEYRHKRWGLGFDMGWRTEGRLSAE